MGNLKTLVFLTAYEDSYPSNSPKHNNFKWTREINNSSISNALSETFQIAPGTTQTLFDGTRTISQDNTTEYSLTLVPLNTSLYQLTYVSGTAPSFRTLRTIGTDATTQVTTSINGPILTYTFTGGTLPTLTSVQPGDDVLIGDLFNPDNQGIAPWQIVSLTTNSISVVNPNGLVQGPVILGSDFATQLRIFSSAGVQVGDTLIISGGFSPVSQNSYLVSQVTDYYVQFSYAGLLPTEGPIQTEDIAFYSMAKTMIYMESDQMIEVLINGLDSGPIITPLISNGTPFPGLFLLNSTVYSLSLTNNSINQANITLLSSE